MNIYFNIIKKFNLDNYFNIILNYNKSNNAPYHNMYHLLCVMKNCFAIAKSEGYTNKEIRPLLIAALFHDFNHSMGKKKDSENVKEAIKEFLKYSEESKEDNEKIVAIIEATEFPYVIDKLNQEQKIIRDADLMQIFADNYFQQNILGLAEEFSSPLSKFLEGQTKFMDEVKFNTEYGKRISNKYLDDKKEDCEYLKQVLSKK